MDISIIISLAALLISGFILLKDYILPAKLKIFVGDSLQIVYAARNKIQINFNFTNSTNKLLVVNKLAATLDIPGNKQYTYVWNVFYRLKAVSSELEQLPTSIAVLAKSSAFQGIEFISSDTFKWVEGRYDFSISGWSNKGMGEDSNICKKVSFSLKKEDVEDLNASLDIPHMQGARLRQVKIIN
ncbi:hypothetical protein IH982_02595 [Patescibacteria group bacterium]|nr:hypothetical protein [Patescibacteria group bacterium]